MQSRYISQGDPLCSFLPARADSASPTVIVSDICSSSTETLQIVRLHKDDLHLIDSFVDNGIVVALPPFRERVFVSK